MQMIYKRHGLRLLCVDRMNEVDRDRRIIYSGMHHAGVTQKQEKHAMERNILNLKLKMHHQIDHTDRRKGCKQDIGFVLFGKWHPMIT